MAREVSKPHDNLFRSVFREESEAAGLLRAHLPEAIERELQWSSLKSQDVTFIDKRLRDSESDLLFAVQRKAGGESAWLYVLLEHRSTPDRWLRLRLLKYSIRIWERDRRRHRNAKRLRPIVPVVLYQGGRRWRYAREFSALFGAEVREWPGVPHYAHLLIDQTKAGPEELRGELHGSHRATGDDGGVPGALGAAAAAGGVAGGAGAGGQERRPGADPGVHCDDGAGTGALAQIPRRRESSGAGRSRTDEQDREDA